MDATRWVALENSELCVGCRQCERTCPFSAIVIEGPMLVAARALSSSAHPVSLLGDSSEIRTGFADWAEALAEANRCLQCPDPTCVRGCPAHNDIPAFIAAIRDHDLSVAHEVLARTTVLPDVCSRVCNEAAQCEGACSWSLAGGTPVAIGRLERFIADTKSIAPPTVSSVADRLSVGIIGSGPAAVGAAWDLIEAGCGVTVYEKDATPGGLCRWGIPEFTLSEEIALRPWNQLVSAGLDLRCHTEIHPDELDELLATHDALIVAIGAGVPLRLPVAGAELAGVVDATSFLQGAKTALEVGGDLDGFRAALGLDGLGGLDARPHHVVVLGAGNTAMDVARTARRCGWSATCVDWLDERFAMARPDELADARLEGVKIRFSRTLTALYGRKGRVARAELADTFQSRADQKPKVLSGNVEQLDVDLVVMAMGYRNDPEFVSVLPGTPIHREVAGVLDRRWAASGILANKASSFAHHYDVGTLSLRREIGLWAAALPVRERLWVIGDALTGPATVVESMAQGRRAAAAVRDARPHRPGHVDGAESLSPQRVIVGYASLGGTTTRAAQEIADGFAAHGHTVRVLPIARIGAKELASADALVVGTWVEGFVVAGVGPAKPMREWLRQLPRFGGRSVVVFCTYGVSPKNTLRSMRRMFEEKGAVIVGQAAFGPQELSPRATIFGPRAFGEELALTMSAKRGIVTSVE